MLAVPVVVVLALACGSHAPGGGRPSAGYGAVVLTGHVLSVLRGDVSAQQVAAGQATLGRQLLERLCDAAPDRSALLSPASAALALGMLDAGARGRTRPAVDALLHLPAWSPAVVAALHEQSVALRQVHQVSVSNHLFEQSGVTPTQGTLDDLQTGFGADVRTVDLAGHPAAATDTINQTVSRDTHGLIPALFDAALSAATSTVLTDAVYLHANWQTPFTTTTDAPFTTAAGRTVTAHMMSGDVSGPLRTADGWQSVALPYQGGALEAVALLPPPTAGSTCALPTASAWPALTSGPGTATAGVVLPRLHLSQMHELSSMLAGLGLPLDGDYSGLGAGDTHIDQVVQKAVLDVDEKGTTAAAATGISMSASAPVLLRTLTFDRPFLLLLQDTATHTPLFLTRVTDPS